jgi:hypothetical protein
MHLLNFIKMKVRCDKHLTFFADYQGEIMILLGI